LTEQVLTARSSLCISSALILGIKIKVMMADTIAKPDPIQKTPCGVSFAAKSGWGLTVSPP
jgi:hypothetical protein